MEELTKKQQGFVRDYVATGNGTQSALKNYDIESDKPEKVASVIATENLAKPSIQRAIKSIAEYFTEEELAQVHKEGLQAYKEEKDIEGNVVQKPDFAVRHKYLDSAYKLKGSYAPERNINLNFNEEIKEDPELNKLREEYNEKMKQRIINNIQNE